MHREANPGFVGNRGGSKGAAPAESAFPEPEPLMAQCRGGKTESRPGREIKFRPGRFVLLWECQPQMSLRANRCQPMQAAISA